jgi:hypothetical protein
MNLNDIFMLYNNSQPVEYEIKETSHGDNDFRQAVVAKWPDKIIVIKITHNDFTTHEHIKGWYNTKTNIFRQVITALEY